MFNYKIINLHPHRHSSGTSSSAAFISSIRLGPRHYHHHQHPHRHSSWPSELSSASSPAFILVLSIIIIISILTGIRLGPQHYYHHQHSFWSSSSSPPSSAFITISIPHHQHQLS
ncbi:hypothetical protein DICPUDRAFT_160418 [Dictyostelium purpureum]|uniref:Uncharacterized protein n=1 Tax=Dictyostelium purpureum TaxID=5786 RepID=F1A6B0_DICPU|nr:uncharacterized protein DICPUDRAFT_160418 [Dictyostelium purpureum]EGC28270.1 hypothetical protein DICPUDRAFT_160418 [Dictyostelium purpureum]|eukprot:XP_003295203.1 hypothetical protein DICPUDRAFT_160418 [Dictyostelium purpureum]